MVVNQKCIRNHEINFELARFHDESKKAVNPERLIQVGDVLINSTGTGTLGRTAQVRTDPIHPVTVDTHVTIARPIQSLFYPPYFGYGLVRLEAEFVDSSTGTSGQTELNRKAISENHFICIPPIAEQERIVEVLDEAFAAIDKAKANIERNLTNARELFQSRLNDIFSNPFEDWEVKAFEEVFKGRSPKMKIPRKQYLEKGNHPVVSQEDDYVSGFTNEDDSLNRFEGPVIIFGDHTRVVKYIDFPFAQGADGVKILVPDSNVIPKFMFHQLEFRKPKSLGYARHFRLLKKFSFVAPPIAEQERIVRELDSLDEMKRGLETQYQLELDNLEELRQSILEQAFEGKLTEPVAA